MKLTGKLSETYLPKFLKNQGLPETDQIKITIKHPSQGERELLSSDIRYLQSDRGTEIQVKTKHKELIESCVVSLINLETEMDGVISTGKALMQARDPRLSALIDELVVHIKANNELSEDSEKN